MKIDGTNNNQKLAGLAPESSSKVLPAATKRESLESKKTDESLFAKVVKSIKKEELSKEAREVAERLQNMVDESNIRFVVKDPTGTGSNNVVIEVLNENNQVVARIPEEVINNVHDEIMSDEAHKIPTGMIIDSKIS